jgi:hypothetical protein
MMEVEDAASSVFCGFRLTIPSSSGNVGHAETVPSFRLQDDFLGLRTTLTPGYSGVDLASSQHQDFIIRLGSKKENSGAADSLVSACLS